MELEQAARARPIEHDDFAAVVAGVIGGVGFPLAFFGIPALAGVEIHGPRSGEGMAPVLWWMFQTLGAPVTAGLLFGAPFTAFGAFLGARMYAVNEHKFHAMLAGGARVPDAAPQLRWLDWLPFALITSVACVVLGLMRYLAIEDIRPQ